jgi:hypothetical protein
MCLPVLVEASKYKTRKKRLKRTSVRDGEDRHATCVRLNSDVLTILKFLIFVSTIGCIITGLSAAEHPLEAAGQVMKISSRPWYKFVSRDEANSLSPY